MIDETITETIQRDSSISFPFLGEWSINPPAFFTLFGRQIYFYGVIIAAGFILAIIFCSKKSKEFGIKSDELYDLSLWLIPLSILGARLYFVVFNIEYYTRNPGKILAIWEGGLAIYGGVIAGIITIALYCRIKKLSTGAMLDLLVFGLLIGQTIGRWGNFFNREAFGRPTEVFCRMGLTDLSSNTIYVHPTFLYESLWNLCLFVFLLIFAKKKKRSYDGQYILIYFLVYGLGRFWIEGLRTDSLYIGNSSLRASQVLSLALVLAAGVVLLIQSRRKHPREMLFVNMRAETESCGEAAEAEVNCAEESEVKVNCAEEVNAGQIKE